MAWSQQLTDAELASLLCSDPEAGFSLLLQRFGARINGYLKGHFPSLDDAQREDVLTDAMLGVARSFDASRGSLAAWLLLLAHQQAVRRLRDAHAQLGVAEPLWSDVSGGEDPQAVLETTERLQQLRAALASLPGLERAVLEADMEAGRPERAEQLARQLETTEASIYAARRRGRVKLRQRCEWVRQWLQRDERDNHE